MEMQASQTDKNLIKLRSDLREAIEQASVDREWEVARRLSEALELVVQAQTIANQVNGMSAFIAELRQQVGRQECKQ